MLSVLKGKSLRLSAVIALMLITGALVAVLGLDIDAHPWKWNVAARVALPVGLTLALFIVLLVVFAVTRRVLDILIPEAVFMNLT
jgi:hypothetical protein